MPIFATVSKSDTVPKSDTVSKSNTVSKSDPVSDSDIGSGTWGVAGEREVSINSRSSASISSGVVSTSVGREAGLERSLGRPFYRVFGSVCSWRVVDPVSAAAHPGFLRQGRQGVLVPVPLSPGSVSPGLVWLCRISPSGQKPQ